MNVSNITMLFNMAMAGYSMVQDEFEEYQDEIDEYEFFEEIR
jgi:hypothetical protein